MYEIIAARLDSLTRERIYSVYIVIYRYIDSDLFSNIK